MVTGWGDKMKQEATCLGCQTSFEYETSQSGGNYCSHKCQQDHRILTIMEGNPKIGNAKTYLHRFVDYACSECGIIEWNEKALSLQIDHIDGDRKNNKIDNIRWLCPNCHSQGLAGRNND